MLGFHAVVVADYAAGFGPELVGCGGELGEKGEFGTVEHDVEDVGVVVEGVEAVGVGVDDGGEDGFGFVVVFGMVVEEGALGFEEVGGWEDFGELV